jgi:hypothetical protein
MRRRNFLALVAAVLMAASLAMLPAHAKTAVCPPACAVSGTVAGSVIRPPFDMMIKGTIFDTISQRTFSFNVEGPYNFAPGTLGRGTVKVEGPGAPNGQYKLWANVDFDGTLDNFTMRNAGPSNVVVGGHFSYDTESQTLVGDHVSLDSNPEFGGGDGGCCIGGT